MTVDPAPDGGHPEHFRAARETLLARTALSGSAFCRAYAGLADDFLGVLATSAGITDGSGMALVAVGGYGRRELCPGSDLDVTLVHKGRSSPKAAADAVWYPVWDTGVGLDHSVRSMKDVLTAASSDLKVVLGLLDGRLVAGDRAVAVELMDKGAERWRRGAERWLPELLASTEDRHRQFGEVAFLLEPELKEGEGGLRDLAALRALAVAAPVVEDWRAEPQLAEAHETLLAVRVQLHRQAGRCQDRLLLAEQDGVAAALGYEDADALMGAVATAARGVAWAADDAWRRVSAWLAGPKGRRGGADRPLGPGLLLRDGEVALTANADPEEDPSLALRAGAAAAELGVPLARSCVGRLAGGVQTLDGSWPPEVRNALVRLLGAGPAAIPVLEALDHTGVLSRLLPEWEPVRHRPQRNAFHRFTVDRHLCEAAANAAALVRRVRRPDLLLVGAWLHDIGKGYPGDHTRAGMEVVARIGARMGFQPADVDVLVKLVQHHLLLPDAATRRDVDDPATVATVAEAVGDLDTLELLAALAEADGQATGPAAWGPWKAGLVDTLVRSVAATLTGAPFEAPPGLPTDEHRRLMAAGGVQVAAAGTTVTVVASDRPGLLAAVAGVLTLRGLDVLSAAAASEDGMAVEVFEVAPAVGQDGLGGQAVADAVRDAVDDLAADLEAAFAGRIDLETALAEKERTYARSRRPRAARPAEARVIIDNGASDAATVIEVRSPDAAGILHGISRTLADHGLNVVSAKVSTLGHEVVDAFYVVGPERAKIVDEAEMETLQAALMERLGRR
jgi:[protein-PII] uridylyltransferase